MPYLSDLLLKCDILCLQELMLTKQDCHLLNTSSFISSENIHWLYVICIISGRHMLAIMSKLYDCIHSDRGEGASCLTPKLSHTDRKL